MRFLVIGVDGRTGADVRKVYEARSEEAVIIMANADHVMVERVRLATAAEGERVTEAAEPVPALSAQPVVEYRGKGLGRRVPEYVGLQIAGFILRIYAFLLYGFGVLALMAGLASALSASTSGYGTSATSGVMAFLLVLLPSLACLFCGGIAHGLGSGCWALRDIARNSWR